MGLIINNEKTGGLSLKWLGSAHASNEAQTVTLKVSAFTAFGENIPSGVPLKKDTDGLYVPVADAGDTLAGFLLTDQPARGEHQVAPMIWHGRIRVAYLPEGAFDVTTLTEVSDAFVFSNNEAVEV
ncbi:hypothetical protein ACXM2N_03485 [Corynebacterium sp. ZY180755]